MPQGVAPVPVLRVCSCLTGDPARLPGVEEGLAHAFGPVAARSLPYPFELTDYYREEMGPDLERTWFCFRDLMDAETLVESRMTTGGIEREFSVGGRRMVNLDPGYLDHGKLVLASRKEAPDKIYMGHGIWAHTCLRYRFGEFEAPDHSFPDFQDGRFDEFFTEARRLYKRLLQEQGSR
jgi:hypothetical protein